MRVLSIPARRNVATNAYTALMAAALETAGAVVEDFSSVRVLLSAYAIVHIHWPHAFAHGRSTLGAWFKALSFVASLWWQKALGARIVWTVHDLDDTIGARPGLQRFIMAHVNRVTDGLVFLSESSRTAALAARPGYAKKATFITLHGAYGAAYPCAGKAEARAAFEIAPGARVVGYVGDVKPYKGLTDLLAAYRGAGADAPTLLVAGQASDPAYAADVRAEIEALIASGAPVVWVDKRLSNVEMSAGLAACDLVIAPYRVSWNSGLATLALEHARPLLCREAPIFAELQSEVGEGWLMRYEAPLTVAKIETALAQPKGTSGAIKSFVARRDWDSIGRGLNSFYTQLQAR